MKQNLYIESSEFLYNIMYTIGAVVHDQSPPKPAGSSPKPPRLCSEGDVGVFVAQKSTVNYTDHDKYQLVLNHFTPDSAYTFPKGFSRRSFQHKWLLTDYGRD